MSITPPRCHGGPDHPRPPRSSGFCASPSQMSTGHGVSSHLTGRTDTEDRCTALACPFSMASRWAIEGRLLSLDYHGIRRHRASRQTSSASTRRLHSTPPTSTSTPPLSTPLLSPAVADHWEHGPWNQFRLPPLGDPPRSLPCSPHSHSHRSPHRLRFPVSAHSLVPWPAIAVDWTAGSYTEPHTADSTLNQPAI